VKAKLLIGLLAIAGGATAANAQSWKNCIPNSIGPGGCNSIAPGGGRSTAPGGGQSIAPGGGRSIAPDGGLSSTRDWNRGLDPNTLKPAPGAPNLLGGRRNDSGSGSAADPQ